MFDMSKVGRNIAGLRKRSGMSQMMLADRLSISYQAVSNWERGETMPDISKLPQLAAIFEVSIDEILDESKETQLLKKVLEPATENGLQQEEVSLKEISDIAPLLHTEQVQELVSRAQANVNIGNLMFIAPFVSQTFLDELVQQVELEEYRAAELLALAPFISTNILDQCVTKLFQSGGNGAAELAALAPFLSKDVMDLCARNLFATEHGGVAELMAIVPFMSSSAVEACAKAIVEREGAGALHFIAPFMSSNTI
ncbi:helix-turn-helix domain-containing protein [Paenibacillus glycanilyticus]|uniref:HTH cro/C1-type domain-containing protein n=1 Tax=Paenibacillus glycanilyticus TaxID=126569 RepID=A0ABQ6GI70_9BACL|nr:helix-turn-helix domain-containing protein [Paenibacillus glycanilyticus]GLX70636.1 hypothetical protein MU1_49820 [Paenibacillus glycanilyticus]